MLFLFLCYRRNRQHPAKQPLQSHDMYAFSPLRKEMAIAMPLSVAQFNNMTVIFAPELGGKRGDGDTFRLCYVTLGFFDFPNEAGLHVSPPLKVYNAG